MEDIPNNKAPERPIMIFHISDLHFGDEDADKIKALMKDIEHQKPDFFCVTGDIVNFPRRKNFLKAKTFLKEIGAPDRVFVIPGNHDAFFGRFGIGRFKKFLQRELEFAEHLEIHGKDICLIGINSTSPSLRGLQNTGHVSPARIQKFHESVEALKEKLGEARYRNARKIVLLHHHPLPTVTSDAEAMVYLHKAGYFLSEMSNEAVDIILHGHQHDPCDFSINYNVGGDSDWMIVLSAGTAFKRLAEPLLGPGDPPQDVCGNTHYYILRMYEDRIDIQGMNYHKKKKEFVEGKGSTKRLSVEELDKFDLEITYTIESPGDLVEEGKAVYRAKPGKQVKETMVVFGVDAASPEATLEACDLQAFRNGIRIDPKHLSASKDSPREKEVKVTLTPPVGTAVETITWRYRWPNGWKNLIDNGLDRGSFYFRRKTDKLEMKIINKNLNLSIRRFHCTAYNGADLRVRDNTPAQEVGFVLNRPKKYYSVSYEVALS